MDVIKWIIRFIMNFVWKITGGIIFALLWMLIGAVLALTVIGIPEAKQCFRIAYFAWKPWGRDIVIGVSDNVILSILWGVSMGIVMLALSIIWLVTLTISILGIPLIYQWYKVLKVSICPFNAVIM